MKTWYYVEDNGNLLTLQAEKPPSWFCGGTDWADTIAEAVNYRRKSLLANMKAASDASEAAMLRYTAFDKAIAANPATAPRLL